MYVSHNFESIMKRFISMHGYPISNIPSYPFLKQYHEYIIPNVICFQQSYINKYTNDNVKQTKFLKLFSSLNHNHQRKENSKLMRKEIQKTNEMFKNVLEIKVINKRDQGYAAVFAKCELEKGRFLFSTRNHLITKKEEEELCKFTKKGSHTMQIDWNVHIEVPLPIRFINHSCVANLGAKSNGNGYDFWSIKSIKEGDELTFDYETTEYEMESPFICQCCANNERNENDIHCRGMIKGFKYNGDIIKDKYPNEFIASYLLK